MQDYSYTTVNSLWRTTAPWGWQTLTSVTIGDGTSAAPQLTAINLNFDGETTGVTPLLSPEGEEGASPWGGLVGVWYTLSGTRLDSKPTQPGLYIHGGRKVMIK